MVLRYEIVCEIGVKDWWIDRDIFAVVNKLYQKNQQLRERERERESQLERYRERDGLREGGQQKVNAKI